VVGGELEYSVDSKLAEKQKYIPVIGLVVMERSDAQNRVDVQMWSNGKFINLLLVLIGAGLTLGVAYARYNSGGKFDVNWSEVLLLVLPSILLSLLTGKFDTFRLSSTGLQIKTAVQKAASKQIIVRDKVVQFAIPPSSTKASIEQLEQITLKHPSSLSLQIRTDNFYETSAMKEYVYTLCNLPDFKYFLFFDKSGVEAFLGGIAASQLCRSLETRDSSLESGKFGPPRANQSVEVELLPIDASSNRLRAFPITIGAAHVHPPAEASRHSQCLDFHENESGTMAGFVKPETIGIMHDERQWLAWPSCST
jgi:hypothetical protein